MTNENIQLEAVGEFPFSFCIEKAVAEEITNEETAEKELILEGVASTANIDHDNERMSKEALQSMANIINEKTVPLRVEHSKSENAVIGKVYKAWVDDRNQLHIRAALDKSHPVSSILHSSMMENGKKMGFSVGGLVKRAVKEFSASVGKLIKTFYDVELKEVSVTPRPANYDAWCMSKSIAKSEAEIEKSRGTAIYDEFLFANPQLDYLQVFAKSVPDEAWQKTNKTTTMTTETEETKEKASETETEGTEKAVSRKDFSVVVKGIESLSKAFGDLVQKLTEETEATTAKTEEETTETEKVTTDETTETETKAADSSTDDYKIESVTRAISTLEGLTKRIQGMKKADAETDSETGTDGTKKTAESESETDAEKASDTEETETTKGVHPLDQFVMTVTKTVEAMVDRMEKSGVSIPGFRKSIVDSIVGDPEMQKEIQKMVKMPGFKKSMSFGAPFMITKDGRRYNLTATEVGVPTIEKSRSAEEGKKTFKEVYKSDFSALKDN